MNIVLAQLKKDIQCQRKPLILWGICLGTGFIALMFLKAFGHVYAPDMSNPKVMIGVLTLGGLALASVLSAGFGMFILLAPILVIRIVHEDVLMGTTAFWLTRPISRKELLAAKSLLIAILPLPSILLGVRFGAGQFWTTEFAWIAAFAAISSITSGTGGFLNCGVALLFGKAVFSAILGAVWTRFHGNTSVFSPAQMLHIDAADFFHLCYFAGLSAVFIHQYLTLQTRRSLAILITILGAVSLLEMLGPIPNAPAAP
jgi:hypothetical protein